MYRVLIKFTDLEDNNRVYKKDDIYPRFGYEPSEVRVANLLSTTNRRKEPLIEELPFSSEGQDKGTEVTTDDSIVDLDSKEMPVQDEGESLNVENLSETQTRKQNSGRGKRKET